MIQDLWYNKYRPHQIVEYVWVDENFRERFRTWINNPSSLPNLILHGPPGTGKTSLAYLLKHELQVEDQDFLFLNASKHSGIETVRGLVSEFCENHGWGGMRLVVFDEAERLTRDAQEALRNLIEVHNDSVRFIFTCNDVRRMVTALQGRCKVFQIDALDQEDFIERLADICRFEQVPLTDASCDALARIVEHTYPNLRKAIIELQEAATSEGLVYVPHQSQTDQEPALLLLAMALEGKGAADIRLAVNQIRRDDLEPVYQCLYENSGEFKEHEGEAILIIAEHLVKHAQVGFPEINLCAALIRLRDLTQG